MTALLVDPLPGRDDARDRARAELADPDYAAEQPPLVARAVQWLLDRLQDLLDRASDQVPGGRLGLVLALTLVVAAVTLVLLRVRPDRASRPSGALVGAGEASRSAADHRAASRAAEAAGDLYLAVVEGVRALARELEERSLLVARPGRTADEMAAEAGAALPSCADLALAAARAFDGVRYGGRHAGPADVAAVRAADEAVTRGRARATAAP